jgi:phage gp36-like protein
MPYATRADLSTYGLPDGTLDGVDDAVIDAALVAASNVADGSLAAAGYRISLLTWSTDLTQAVCAVASWDLMCRRGFNPDSGADAVIRQRYEDAQEYLKDIAMRRRKVAIATEPPITDSPPADTATLGRVSVVTGVKRGW